jgi:hypothetical protein
MSDEDVPSDYYQYQEDDEYSRIENIIQEKIAN